MPLDYLPELKESCAIAKSRSLTVTRATKITEWKSALKPLSSDSYQLLTSSTFVTHILIDKGARVTEFS